MNYSEFMKLVDELMANVCHQCLVLQTEKQYNSLQQEASFSIRVRFKKNEDVKPDLTIEGKQL